MIPTISILFFAAIVLWLFYWAVVRQSILDGVEDDFCNLRSQVAWHIINGSDGSTSRSALMLEEEIPPDGFIHWISFSSVVFHLYKNRARIKAEAAKDREIFEASPKWIRETKESVAKLSIKAALANSPIWWGPLALILLCAIFSKKALDWWNDAENTATQLRFGMSQPI